MPLPTPPDEDPMVIVIAVLVATVVTVMTTVLATIHKPRMRSDAVPHSVECRCVRVDRGSDETKPSSALSC
eukprot:653565-Alexandrium_andersonii.AAC.2